MSHCPMGRKSHGREEMAAAGGSYCWSCCSLLSGQLRALFHWHFSRDLWKVSHMDLSEGHFREKDGKLKVLNVGLLSVLKTERRPV